MHQPKITTSNRNLVLRLLFVAVALILRNFWVRLHGEMIPPLQRSRRQLHAASPRLN